MRGVVQIRTQNPRGRLVTTIWTQRNGDFLRDCRTRWGRASPTDSTSTPTVHGVSKGPWAHRSNEPSQSHPTSHRDVHQTTTLPSSHSLGTCPTTTTPTTHHGQRVPKNESSTDTLEGSSVRRLTQRKTPDKVIERAGRSKQSSSVVSSDRTIKKVRHPEWVVSYISHVSDVGKVWSERFTPCGCRTQPGSWVWHERVIRLSPQNRRRVRGRCLLKSSYKNSTHEFGTLQPRVGCRNRRPGNPNLWPIRSPRLHEGPVTVVKVHPVTSDTTHLRKCPHWSVPRNLPYRLPDPPTPLRLVYTRPGHPIRRESRSTFRNPLTTDTNVKRRRRDVRFRTRGSFRVQHRDE